MNERPELLSPAGTFECVAAAVQNGCSAVYAGTGTLNARQNACNFTLKQLESAVDYCHERGVKLYVTANTLIKEKEIQEFLNLAESIYKMGADGVIVQDIGCGSLIKRYFPDFYLLASTQMTVHDKLGVKFLNDNGFNRIILARELSVAEIADICKESKAEIECFVHGAMCVCYSGQCLMSSLIGNRSGNRGRCAQPCRHNYALRKDNETIVEGSLLSLKDMCGLNALPMLIGSGVKSFKIEGRMKSSEYVAGVTAIYRKYIDMYCDSKESYEVDESDVVTLLKIFNRSGFNDGYFSGKKGGHMLTDNKVGNTGVYLGTVSEYRNSVVKFTANDNVTAGDGILIYAENGHSGAYITRNSKKGDVVNVKLDNPTVKQGQAVYKTYDKSLMDSLKATYEKDKRKTAVNGIFIAKKNEPVSFEVIGDTTVTQLANPPENALKAPLTAEEVRKRLNKTGDTPYIFENIEINIDEGVFISVAELNRLRREALESYRCAVIKKYKRTPQCRDVNNLLSVNDSIEGSNNRLTVLVRTNEQLEAVADYELFRLYVDFPISRKNLSQVSAKEVYQCMPHIERDIRRYTIDAGYDGYLVRTYGQAKRMIEKGISFSVDYTLNIFNSVSADFWRLDNCRSVCVSPELSTDEALELTKINNTEIIIYGKLPVMTTEQCPIGNYGNCEVSNKGRFSIESAKDRYGLLTNCYMCYCQLLPATPIGFLGETGHAIKRIEFTNENSKFCKKILNDMHIRRNIFSKREDT